MSQYTAADFRILANKLNEYTFNEDADDDSAPQGDNQPIDKMLTKPAGIQKITGSLDVDALVNKLNIPSNLQNDFKSAVSSLQDDNPTLNANQAMALATAFDHILADNSAEKNSVVSDLNNVSAAEVTEGDDDIDNRNINIESVIKSIKSASNVSPVAKLQAVKLVDHLTKGVHGKHKNGGISHVLSGIVTAITSAQQGNESDALKHIASMVNHTEGDKHAIDSKEFPNIVVTLMLLVGDLLQHTEE
jgi:hypothetical protein